MSGQHAELPPQVATALTALVQALNPGPSTPAGPVAQPAPDPVVPAQAAADPVPPSGELPSAILAESFADPAPTPQDAVLDAIPAAPAGRIRSRKLWTMVGTVATLVVNNAAGLELSPLAQGLIAGVAGVYIIVQAAVDSVRIKK